MPRTKAVLVGKPREALRVVAAVAKLRRRALPRPRLLGARCSLLFAEEQKPYARPRYLFSLGGLRSTPTEALAWA